MWNTMNLLSALSVLEYSEPSLQRQRLSVLIYSEPSLHGSTYQFLNTVTFFITTPYVSFGVQ